VQCYKCKGSGKDRIRFEYDDFEGRVVRTDVRRVYRANPGIVIGEREGVFRLEDFGGVSYSEWLNGHAFTPGTEDRQHTCPAWFYQCADYDRKPYWTECGYGTFISCKHFGNKAACWARWDKEFGGK